MESTNSYQTQQKRLAKQTGLQKMYLLNEPAFERVKYEIDNEKYLTTLDRDLKKILYNSKIPAYRKWLQYREILAQYFNFQKFLKESQTEGDEASTQKLLKMENQIKSLEKQLQTQTELISPPPQLVKATDIEEEPYSPSLSILGKPLSEKKTTPGDRIDLNQSIQTTKAKTRKSTTPQEENMASTSAATPQSRRMLDFGTTNRHNESFFPLDDSQLGDITMHTAAAGEEEIFGNESTESNGHVPMDMSIPTSEIPYTQQNDEIINFDESGENHRLFDNELIRTNTIRQRLDAMPEAIRRKFLVKDAYPKHTFKVVFHDEDEREDHEMQIDPFDATIVDGNVLRMYNKNSGYIRFNNVQPDSLNTIRLYLIEFHTNINNALKTYNETRGNYIGSKKYSILNKDNKTKVIRFKGTTISVPNEIVDDVISFIDQYEPTALDFKENVTKMKKTHQRNENRVALKPSILTQSTLATSTPSSARNKRSAADLTHGENTLNILKNPPKRHPQEGSGFKWKKI